MAFFVFVCDLGADDQFLGVIVQCFSCLLEFDRVETLSADEYPDLCDELTGPFYSRFLLLM